MKRLESVPEADWCARCRVNKDLADSVRLQRLLAEVSAGFVGMTPGGMDQAIDAAQRLICESLGVDRSTLWQAADRGSSIALTHYWQLAGLPPLRRNFVTEGNLPWCDDMLKKGQAFHFSSLAELPPEASADVATLRQHGTRSNATFPLLADGKLFGALAFGMITRERSWEEEEIAGLKLIAEMFGHVIRRQRAEQRAEQLRNEIQGASRAAVLGDLAAALAHEINQPLTTILSNAQAARRFILQGTSGQDEIIAILDDIIRDDKRAGNVIRSLRAMLSDAPLPREASDLNLLVADVAGFLGKELARDGITLRLDLGEALPEVRIVRVEIQQMLHNLVLNAAHAMGDTPPENRSIEIETRCAGANIRVRVVDRGCGIPPEHFDRIFEPFHTTRGDGLGMGLAICRRITEAHGGSLVARNRETGGAEFTFTLPLSGERSI